MDHTVKHSRANIYKIDDRYCYSCFYCGLSKGMCDVIKDINYVKTLYILCMLPKRYFRLIKKYLKLWYLGVCNKGRPMLYTSNHIFKIKSFK